MSRPGVPTASGSASARAVGSEKTKSVPASGGPFGGHGSSVCFGDLSYDRKAQAGAGSVREVAAR